jgi:hypothetical protein
LWLGRAGLLVVDRLLAERDHAVQSRLHLAPGTALDGPRRAGPFTVAPLGEGMGVEAAEGEHSPWLGARTTAPLLRLGGTARPGKPFGWALLRPPWQITALDRDRVTITRDSGEELVIPLPAGWPEAAGVEVAA